ncbi:hypothetical protein M0804_014388 [Polistes exclamans]|nr:hypothetical protein M0804_014388 [Polistes exclamans]
MHKHQQMPLKLHHKLHQQLQLHMQQQCTFNCNCYSNSNFYCTCHYNFKTATFSGPETATAYATDTLHTTAN